MKIQFNGQLIVHMIKCLYKMNTAVLEGNIGLGVFLNVIQDIQKNVTFPSIRKLLIVIMLSELMKIIRFLYIYKRITWQRLIFL